MGTFYSSLGDAKERTFAGKRLQGFVVKNDDSQDEKEDHRHLQRIKVRIPHLHDKLKDEELPWFSPGNMPSYSGSADIGDHGPVPPVGTKVWVRFEDETQYHGHYLGAVQNKKTKIPEFTDKKGKYTKSYPHASGNVDQSGTLRAIDNKRDTEEWSHVSGTSFNTDGKGNTKFVVNGDAERKDNKDAGKDFPKGFTMAVFGNKSIYVSGDIEINVKGKAKINVKGDADIKVKGDVNISGKTVNITGETLNLSGQTLNVSAHTKIALDAPSITSSVPAQLAGGKSAANRSEPSFEDQKAPTARARPKPSSSPTPAKATSGKI